VGVFNYGTPAPPSDFPLLGPHITVHGLYVSDAKAGGLVVYGGAKPVAVSNNTFFANGYARLCPIYPRHAPIPKRVIHSTVASADGTFGDGILAWLSAEVHILNLTVSLSSRAGISAFGSYVVLENVELDCNMVDLDGEPVGDVGYTIADDGGNICHCGEYFVACPI